MENVTPQRKIHPHGSKGDFRKISITLPPEDYEKLLWESARRKIAGEPNHLISSVVREAVTDYVRQLGDEEKR